MEHLFNALKAHFGDKVRATAPTAIILNNGVQITLYERISGYDATIALKDKETYWGQTASCTTAADLIKEIDEQIAGISAGTIKNERI